MSVQYIAVHAKTHFRVTGKIRISSQDNAIDYIERLNRDYPDWFFFAI